MIKANILKKELHDGMIYLLFECPDCGFKYWLMPEEESFEHTCGTLNDGVIKLSHLVYGELPK